MSGETPNAEQKVIGRAFGTGENMVIEALAGTGKTSTLEILAKAYPRRRMLYIAYNKAIQVEAAARFPGNVACKTSHGLAYGRVGRLYGQRINGARVPSKQAARYLDLRDEVLDDPVMGPTRLADWKQAQLAMGTVEHFCYSADREITDKHVPWMPGLAKSRAHIVSLVLPAAQAAWKDVIQPDSIGGRLKCTHDVYMKLYQLSNPRLPWEVILLDEAQDTNPCVADLVMSQRGAQVVLVGDSNQAIYGWRGATDAMISFEAKHRLPLTGSYRFGPELADEANKWLRLLGSEQMLKGYKQISTAIDDGAQEDAVLTRTNGQAIAEVIQGLETGRRVHLVGGAGPIAAMARAAASLLAGVPTDHPELLAFESWEQVQRYVRDDPSGSDLAPFVQMVDAHGADAILATVNRLVPEEAADLIVSTAHKSKGRQWGSVRIGPDFKIPEDGGLPSKDEMQLSYVALTRARFHLQRGSLAAVDRMLEGDHEVIRTEKGYEGR